MKIALIGYGKMGKAIEEIAVRRGHQVVLRVTSKTAEDLTASNLSQADAAIEFTSPQSAVRNIKACFDTGVPVVCGSTGWLHQWDDAAQYCRDKNGAFLYASNFSIGVNLFFELNTYLAALMSPYDDYDVAIEEVHHTQKKDAPSGTAITLAGQILQKIQRKKSWTKEPGTGTGELEIRSRRIDPAPGTHIVTYSSDIDDIRITHTAHSRKGFASGAVLAAEFLKDRKGIYSMKDVLSL